MSRSYSAFIILIISLVFTNEEGGKSLSVPVADIKRCYLKHYNTKTKDFKYESNPLSAMTNDFNEQFISNSPAPLSRLLRSLRGGGKKSTSRRKTRSIHNWKAKHKRPGENPLQESIFVLSFEI